MVERLPVTEPVPLAARAESALAAAERAIREADPAAFPVASRIVRRVIRHEIDLPPLSTRVPHRKSFNISAERARQIVMNDELGLDPAVSLPETVILLARPEEHELEAMTAPALCEHLRRLHFHARVHVALDERRAEGQLDDRTVRDRIERIGYTAFDEIRSVLSHEAYLLPPVSAVSEYVEFAAVFLELRYFAPDVLASYFPSVDDIDRVEEILAEDVDADSILQMTVDLATDDSARPAQRIAERGRLPADIEAAGPRTSYAFQKLLRDAAHTAVRGNDVRAAILHTRAAAVGQPKLAEQATAFAEADIRRLADRLRQALKIEVRAADPWCDLLAALLKESAYGFWNPAARLLYDLQKVCLDSERVSYVIDLLGWLLSLGRRPLKRPLPAQREVLLSKHLRIATSRLEKVQLSAGEREHLAILLRGAAVSAEHRLRERLRPPLEDTLIEVGFLPQNLPERVSFRKIVEELLDAVVERGFFAMGDIRDAIARNNLKLDDVADPLELVAGDRLLRADRRLADVLDGVYQRGAFYLRGLQRLSSCAFGTRAGRSLTLYAAIPFGGAYVILAFIDHLEEAARHLVNWWSGEIAETEPAAAGHPNLAVTIALGFFLLGLIHVPRFRRGVWHTIRLAGRSLRFLFYDVPKWLAEVTFINRLLRSPAFVFFRKRLLTSLILTALFCWLLPAVGWYQLPRPSVTACIFVILAGILNSRAGRDIEELAAERLQLMWHRIRVHVLVALFDLVMDFFKHVLEWLERVLYEVDEWLRFKSGETKVTLGLKAVLGVPWTVMRFVVGFLVTVLVEPQINPIKHFPVVTVSHKVILPMQPILAGPLDPIFGKVLANTIAGMTVLLLPGVVGFLVWELRGNWRLYAVNRHRDLKPVVVGSHGETLVRLMKLGLHSGTLPRLFARLRRAARRANPTRRLRGLMGYYAKLHHLELDVRRFFEREFLGFLAESTAFNGIPIEVGQTEVGTNSLRVEIRAPQLGDEPLWIAFEEQAGRMVAGVWRAGWIRNLTEPQRAVLGGLLVGFYRIGGVDLVREQVIACLGSQARPYDVTERGLTLLPGSTRQEEVVYDVDEFPEIVPRIVGAPSAASYPTVDAESLVFGRTRTLWVEWVAAWSREDSREPFPTLLPPKAHPEAFTPLL
jgi:hypothetical protein